MKFKILNIIAIASFGCVSAQVQDSIFVPKNQLYAPQYLKIWENPIQYSDYHFGDFTETELSATIKENNLKRAQVAESSNQFEFKTQGIFNINENLRLLGGFDYQFVTEKDLGFNLSNGRTEDQFVLNPHYIFVPKKAHWESQKYKVNAGVSYNISNFDMGATIDYKNENSFRKSDPRPAINTADYSGKIFLGYHLQKHQLSIFGGLGRKTDTYDLDFVDASLGSPANQDYFVRFSDGYGRLIYFSHYDDFNYKTIDKNFGAGYAYRGEKNYFTINYSYSKSMETLYGQNADGYTYFNDALAQMKYRLIHYETDANYWYKGDKMEYFTHLNFQSITGDNYSLTEMGQNYRMTLDKLTFSNYLIWKDAEKTKLGIGLEAAYSDFSAIDLLGITHKYVKSLDLNLKVNKDIFYTSTQKINVEVGAQSYFPLSESLTYNPASSTQIFYDNVIRKDYYFDKTTKIGPKIGIQFFQKVRAKTDLKIFTNFASLFSTNSVLKDNTDYNGNPNLVFNAGISLYY